MQSVGAYGRMRRRPQRQLQSQRSRGAMEAAGRTCQVDRGEDLVDLEQLAKRLAALLADPLASCKHTDWSSERGYAREFTKASLQLGYATSAWPREIIIV
eukprot:5001430-Pleurochrysis_carterae.AAC.2